METRRFERIDETWNPVVGCLHNCTYCWARRLAETKLRDIQRYKDGFKPKLIEYELNRRFHDKFVFVSDMGDLFGDWVPDDWIVKVIESVRRNPSSYFLFLTKNPGRFTKFLDLYPGNVVLGATIETNREYEFTKAPQTAERYRAIASLQYRRRLVSVEPIMDFDLEVFVQWIKDIDPVLVHVGYDNYRCGLPEPPLSKTRQLVDQLNTFTRVKELTLRERSRGN